MRERDMTGMALCQLGGVDIEADGGEALDVGDCCLHET